MKKTLDSRAASVQAISAVLCSAARFVIPILVIHVAIFRLSYVHRSRYDREEGVSESKLAKRRPGRLHKWIGDTCLLAGSPKVQQLLSITTLRCLMFMCFGITLQILCPARNFCTHPVSV